ncbi:MAG: hypothetical protein WBN40_00835, partial [Pseudomonadales bacterium]
AASLDGIDNAPDPEGNKALFTNIDNTNFNYWTDVEHPAGEFIYFDARIGSQSHKPGAQSGALWPVADGMVGLPLTSENVPLPYWALLVLGGVLTGVAHKLARK